MRTTLCWRCSAPYPETNGNCPRCGATNANVDYKAAMTEMNQDRQDDERAERAEAERDRAKWEGKP